MHVQCHLLLFTLTVEIKTIGAAPAPTKVQVGGVLLGEEAGAVVADRVRAGEPFLREAIATALVRVVRVCAVPLGLQHGQR